LVGLGVKLPTGDSAAKDVYPDISGANYKQRYVDQSVQPGDGGWGLMMDISGFKQIPHAQLFGQASYLANPRDSNDTLSIAYNIQAVANPTINPDGTSYNSVPDQYLVRLGAAAPIGKTGFAASLAWHAEGLPRYDLIGQSHGFRRPGVEMFIEPGFSYARGSDVYSFEVPIAYYRNRFANPYTGNAGDATFPNYIFLASYSRRFGGKDKPNTSILATKTAAVDLPGVGSTASSSSTPATSATAAVAGTAFKSFKLKTLDGAQKTLPDVLGKTTLVVFFYPTCPFCNVAAPDVQRLYDKYKDQGLSVQYINIYPNEEKLVAGWLAEHHYTAPVLVGAKLNDVQRDYDVQATPTDYLLDAKGRVISKHSGYTAGDSAALEQEIKNALTIAGGSQ
jgi:cytochrome oxidase Cu insertion factor (SCO1/SenC/PrrC family)